MNLPFTTRLFHEKAIIGATILLTLWPFFLPQQLRADDGAGIAPDPPISAPPFRTPLDDADRNYRLALLLDYLRHEGSALVPNLPDIVRAPVHFVMEQLQPGGDALSDLLPAAPGGFLPPVSLIGPPDENNAEALWFASGYHHAHGLLSPYDAATMGFDYRNAALNDHTKLDVHPFYAQNWRSAEGYWGTEAALAYEPQAGQPWGKISVRYDNGDSDLMEDQGRGIDMHADLLFDRHWNFTAGAQQNEPTDLGNYVLLRWRLVGGGQ